MPLAINAIGAPIGPLTKDYTWKDAVLYALGVGAGFSELDYCYEKNLKIIPTFSIAMIFDFFSHAILASGATLAGVLHGEQELIFHAPIPAEGTLITTGTITGYDDMGKDRGALIRVQSDTTHSNGTPLFTGIATVVSRLDGGFGGKAPTHHPATCPDRTPDMVVSALPSPDQPLLYRLSGDIFQLHVDPAFAARAGFEQPIMHGLCTCGFACRALISVLTPGRPDHVRRLRCRFSAPLYPGVPIQTQIWETKAGSASWRILNRDTGDVIIDHGEFEYGPATRRVYTADPAGQAVDAADSVRAIFSTLPGMFVKTAAAGVDAVFQYIITDVGAWQCEIRDMTCTVSEGTHQAPTCTFTLTAENFIRLMNGQLSAIDAFISGALKVEGDLSVAQKSEALFRQS